VQDDLGRPAAFPLVTVRSPRQRLVCARKATIGWDASLRNLYRTWLAWMSSPPLELTGRAGVLPEDVERLVQLGILAPRAGQRPFTPGDVRRVRLASACAEAGLPLEGIGAAMAAGKLIPAVPASLSTRLT
jgi:hypothetical protein